MMHLGNFRNLTRKLNGMTVTMAAACGRNSKLEASKDGVRSILNNSKAARYSVNVALKADRYGFKSPRLLGGSLFQQLKCFSTSDTIEVEALLKPAGPLSDKNTISCTDGATVITPEPSQFFIPQVDPYKRERIQRKRVLVLCTGGTLTMAPDPEKSGALAPVEGSVTSYMQEMKELHHEQMPKVVIHEYSPLLDSSNLGPRDYAVLANDIKTNYWDFDGFVILVGTDTMAYAATALSFMLEVSHEMIIIFLYQSKTF